jgi:hypothetical protein
MSIKSQLHTTPEPGMMGHEPSDPSRFADTTRHMIIFEVLTQDFPIADKGERVRLYVSEKGYQNATARTERGKLKIIRHARVRKGELFYDAPGRETEI